MAGQRARAAERDRAGGGDGAGDADRCEEDLPAWVRGVEEAAPAVIAAERPAPESRGDTPVEGDNPAGIRRKVDEYEARILQEALDAAGWSRRAAAERLGMPVRTLSYRMKRLGLRRRRDAHRTLAALPQNSTGTAAGPRSSVTSVHSIASFGTASASRGSLRSSVDRVTAASIRASIAPRQKWIPLPKAICRFGERPTSKRFGSGN
ncbi:uncharacterized protein SOCEGT47_063700 [Sorangium cellulosum]|uniref:DNA binding HTH domain-containing protein n=1 Tax=Sorangium cellulosum TaxID=56 RepID=A0A4P2Q9C1_SORCE|nr:uncharacterized protein SOCEGT47_063700 [Sorangium cellulosum]